VDVEIRNASDEDLDLPITATLTLRPLPPADGSEPPVSAWLSAALDPLTGAAVDAAGTETPLKLPVRGSWRVRVRLETLGWSLSPPLYVWVPRPLSQVADYPEYELTFDVRAQGLSPESAASEPVRVRLPQP
jgi:hypothetical protein